jgi:hypothetical protein
MVKRVLACLFVWTVTAATVIAQQQQQPARDQYLPIDQLPPSEKMPSAPFVIAAYAVIWALAMFYMWTIWRRAGKVEADLDTLARRQRDAQR